MAESTISSPDIAPRAGLSQVRGADAPPLSNLTIAELLAQSVARFGDRPAAVFREQGIRWSWNEFAAEVEALAAGLRQLGLKTGDRLGIWSPNRSEWVVTQFSPMLLPLAVSAFSLIRPWFISCFTTAGTPPAW